MKIYNGVTDKSTAETAALKISKPDNILGSYFYFKNKGLKEYFEKIGYIPKSFILDSGAFSAFTTGRNISIIDYMTYIKANKDYISHYIALDVIGDAELTYDYFKIMHKRGLNPVPVFHYGDDLHWLQRYSEGCDYIALGGTVPVSDKAKVAKWVNRLQKLYPDVKFHLLGGSSHDVISSTNLFSCDSSTWIIGAINGRPRQIPGSKKEDKIRRAIYNLEYIKNSSQICALI